MHLIITNTETQEVLDKCQATEWLEAIQYVEKNKETLLAGKESLKISITNKQLALVCVWVLAPKARTSLLSDRSYVPPEALPTPKIRARKKAKA